jgi:protease I
MSHDLEGLRIAILATDGFEQVELTSPLQALRAAGARVDVVSPKSGEIQGMNHHEKGEKTKVDIVLKDAEASQYDALVLPGGVANPDTLRADQQAVAFARHFVEAGKPIGAICHGPWTLVEIPDAVRGHTVTSWPSLRTDLKNAGATWVDREVVVDGKLVTSRKPDDLPAFNKTITELLAQVAYT